MSHAPSSAFVIRSLKNRRSLIVALLALAACWAAPDGAVSEVQAWGQQETSEDSVRSPWVSSPPQSKPQDDEALWRGILVAPRVFREAARQVEPYLVTIESFGGVSTVPGRIGGIRRQGEGNTTGVVVSPDGYVVTSSFNFIQQPPVITVITSDGVRRRATLQGRDNTRNICLLKIEDVEGLPTPTWVPPAEIQVGQYAISVGVGYGDKNPAISAGIISAKNRFGARAIQTDANISPANYGGPLIDIEGRLIGICVPLAPGGSSAGAGVEWYDSGIGFAIPLYGAEELLGRLKAGEVVDYGFVGIRPLFLPNIDGTVIGEVIPDGPAERAGLRRGDLIQTIDGMEVPDAATLRQVLNRYVAGEIIELGVRRQAEEESAPQVETIALRLGVRPDDDPATAAPDLFPDSDDPESPDN